MIPNQTTAVSRETSQADPAATPNSLTRHPPTPGAGCVYSPAPPTSGFFPLLNSRSVFDSPAGSPFAYDPVPKRLDGLVSPSALVSSRQPSGQPLTRHDRPTAKGACHAQIDGLARIGTIGPPTGRSAMNSLGGGVAPVAGHPFDFNGAVASSDSPVCRENSGRGTLFLETA